jgi:PAS domain S-box-containing protein/putative nucleotidyltransferase with HDIG domain
MDHPIKNRRRRRALRVLAFLAVAALIVRELSRGETDPLELALFGAVAILLATELWLGYRAQGRLRDAVATGESRYRFVAEQAPVIAYLAELGEDARWHYVSPHITTLLGFTPEEWLENPGLWHRQVHPDDLPLAMSDERRAVRSGEPNATDYRIRTKRGEEIWVRDVALPIQSGKREMTQGVIYDITGLKRAEEGLRTRERMLQGIVRERTRELERSRIETLQRLAIAAELHEEGTREHTLRVGRIAASIAHGMGLSPAFVELIAQAAPLHDIGKLGVSNEILLRPGGLSDTELETMRQHTLVGARILEGSEAPVLRLAEQIALTHHERWDGKGYPRGLAGEEIPIAGRITNVADIFDTLLHERTYREAWAPREAFEEIRSGSGTRHDPAVVDAFLSLDQAALIAAAGRAASSAPVVPLR